MHEIRKLLVKYEFDTKALKWGLRKHLIVLADSVQLSWNMARRMLHHITFELLISLNGRLTDKYVMWNVNWVVVSSGFVAVNDHGWDQFGYMLEPSLPSCPLPFSSPLPSPPFPPPFSLSHSNLLYIRS